MAGYSTKADCGVGPDSRLETWEWKHRDSAIMNTFTCIQQAVECIHVYM